MLLPLGFVPPEADFGAGGFGDAAALAGGDARVETGCWAGLESLGVTRGAAFALARGSEIGGATAAGVGDTGGGTGALVSGVTATGVVASDGGCDLSGAELCPTVSASTATPMSKAALATTMMPARLRRGVGKSSSGFAGCATGGGRSKACMRTMVGARRARCSASRRALCPDSAACTSGPSMTAGAPSSFGTYFCPMPLGLESGGTSTSIAGAESSSLGGETSTSICRSASGAAGPGVTTGATATGADATAGAATGAAAGAVTGADATAGAVTGADGTAGAATATDASGTDAAGVGAAGGSPLVHTGAVPRRVGRRAAGTASGV